MRFPALSPLLSRLRPTSQRVNNWPIGVDFGADRLNLVQCERDDDGIVVRAATSVSYPTSREALFADRKALKHFVRDAMRHSPFVGHTVASSLPAAAVKIVPLTLQVGDKQAEQMAVVRALREKLRTDLAQEVVDYIKVRNTDTPRDELNVLAIVAQRTDVIGHLESLEAAGFSVASLEIGPAALTRLMVALQGRDFVESEVLINFGLAKTYITVVWGRRLMLDREMDFGQANLVKKVTQALSVDEQTAATFLSRYGFERNPSANDPNAVAMAKVLIEVLHAEFSALAEEVSRTLVYIASKTHGRTAQQIYLNGSLAHIPGIARRMEEHLSIKVAVLNPFQHLRTKFDDTDTFDCTNIALSTGLALREDTGD